MTLFLCFYFNYFFLVFSAIISAYPQTVRLVPQGVLVSQIGNHCSRESLFALLGDKVPNLYYL
jgi:hypothetical protein